MRVTIDREECISCAACWGECPEFFEQNSEDTWSQVAQKYRINGNIGEGEMPSDLKDCVTQAAESCPVSIIHVAQLEKDFHSS